MSADSFGGLLKTGAGCVQSDTFPEADIPPSDYSQDNFLGEINNLPRQFILDMVCHSLPEGIHQSFVVPICQSQGMEYDGILPNGRRSSGPCAFRKVIKKSSS